MERAVSSANGAGKDTTLGGGVCAGRAQVPCFCSRPVFALQKWPLGFLVSLYVVQNWRELPRT